MTRHQQRPTLPSRRRNGSGSCSVWRHDLSDAKLAEECKVSETTMKLIRREVFGNLRRGGGASPLQILFEKHSALEAHVAALEKRILALEDYITRTGKAAYGSSQTALPVKPNTVNSFSDLGRIIEKSNG